MPIDLKGITHGCELELSDWPATELAVPSFGLSRDVKDITIVNSNGIANDPSLKLYGFGGEINTPPTETIDEQCAILADIHRRWPEARINYRSNLHWHIRVPGLKDDLEYLKRFARYNAYWLGSILPAVEPITPNAPINKKSFPPAIVLQLKGYNRRQRRRRVSHHTVLPPDRLEKQLAARTVREFHEAEVPRSHRGQAMWHAQPRAAVSLRQLLQTETIEFRHWPGTLDCAKLAMVGQWCLRYIECALGDWGEPQEANPLLHFAENGGWLDKLPTFCPYEHSLEIRYRATSQASSLSWDQLAANIAAILDGSFDEAFWEAKFSW